MSIVETVETNGIAQNLVPAKRARRTSVAPPAGSVEELLAKREEAARMAKEADEAIDGQIASLKEQIAKLEAVRGPIAKPGVPAPTAKAKPTQAPAKPKPAAAKPKGERLARRTDDEIAGMVAQIVELVKAAGPLRAEEIRARLRVEAKALPRALKQGMSTGVLKSEGQKRATAYSAV